MSQRFVYYVTRPLSPSQTAILLLRIDDIVSGSKKTKEGEGGGGGGGGGAPMME